MTNHDARRSSMNVIDERECIILFSTTTVGLVAFVSAAGQQLLPVNFAAIDGMIYLRTSDDSSLAELATGMDDVALGIVHHSTSTRDGWNVTVQGTTAAVIDPLELSRVLGVAKLRPWAPGERDVVVVLTPRSIGGRRVSSH